MYKELYVCVTRKSFLICESNTFQTMNMYELICMYNYELICMHRCMYTYELISMHTYEHVSVRYTYELIGIHMSL